MRRVGVAGEDGEQWAPACVCPCLPDTSRTSPGLNRGSHRHRQGLWGGIKKEVAENCSSYNEILTDSSISVLRPIFTVKRLLIGTLKFHENSRNWLF